MKKQKLRKIGLGLILPFILYVLLTLALSWPLVKHFNSAIPSWGRDSYQVYGIMQSKTYVLETEGFISGLAHLGKNGELNSYLFYVLLDYFLQSFTAINIMFFFSFVLSGFGGYILLRYILSNSRSIQSIEEKNRTKIVVLASFLGGFIFAFSPFHTYQSMATNVGTMHQEWIPFFILFLLKFFEKFDLKYFLLTGVFLSMIAITDPQTLAFTFLFLLAFFIFQVIKKPTIIKDKKLWKYIIAMAVFAVIMITTLFRSMLEVVFSGNNFLSQGIERTARYSNDLLAGFIPPVSNSLWPDFFETVRQNFLKKNEFNTIFIGYSVLGLSALAVYLAKKRRGLRQSNVFFWLICAGVFYVFSSGPYLHVNGAIFSFIPMPYWLIYKGLPFYENIRAVGRLYIYSLVGLSVLASFGSAMLMARFKRIYSVFAAILLVIALEFNAVPLKTDALSHSSFYEKLSMEKEDFNILEIPGSTNYESASRNLVWKNIHHKKSLSVYEFARDNKSNIALQKSTPVIYDLLYAFPKGNEASTQDIFKQPYTPDFNTQVLNHYGVKYIMISKEYVSSTDEKDGIELIAKSDYDRLIDYLESNIRYDGKYEDDLVLAYRVKKVASQYPLLLSFSQSKEKWGFILKEQGRYIDSGAGIHVMPFRNQSQKMIFNIEVSGRREKDHYFLEMYVREEKIAEVELVGLQTKSVATKNITVPGEGADLVFKIKDTQGKEVINTRDNARTARIISIGYQVEP